MKKLIPLAEYIQQVQNTPYFHSDIIEHSMSNYGKILRYTALMLRPLELSDFIPCGENNKPLDYPIKSDYGLDSLEFNTYKYPAEQYEFDLEMLKACESKVLFKGWAIDYARAALCIRYKETDFRITIQDNNLHPSFLDGGISSLLLLHNKEIDLIPTDYLIKNFL